MKIGNRHKNKKEIVNALTISFLISYVLIFDFPKNVKQFNKKDIYFNLIII